MFENRVFSLPGIRRMPATAQSRDLRADPAPIAVEEIVAAVQQRCGPARLALKRMLDLLIALGLCIVLAPLMAAVAIGIRIDSPGPAFFTQKRRGRGFETFTMVKFRSLRHNAPDPHAGYEMLEDDARITRIGAWLRSTSIDELPQLINVIAGSMSLVGPRPLVEWESQKALPRFAARFAMKPGLTGWSQITVRNAVDFDGRCEKDVEYVRRWSIAFDLRILVQTPLALLRGDVIYPDG
jgi:lipopolysaccharide/colanic/teichoic acid biosynthesis glycosyltransferase